MVSSGDKEGSKKGSTDLGQFDVRELALSSVRDELELGKKKEDDEKWEALNEMYPEYDLDEIRRIGQLSSRSFEEDWALRKCVKDLKEIGFSYVEASEILGISDGRVGYYSRNPLPTRDSPRGSPGRPPSPSASPSASYPPSPYPSTPSYTQPTNTISPTGTSHSVPHSVPHSHSVPISVPIPDLESYPLPPPDPFHGERAEKIAQGETDKIIGANVSASIQEATDMGYWLMSVFGPIATMYGKDLQEMVTQAMNFYLLERMKYDDIVEELFMDNLRKSLLIRRLSELADPNIQFLKKVQTTTELMKLKILLSSQGLKVPKGLIKECDDLIREAI